MDATKFTATARTLPPTPETTAEAQVNGKAVASDKPPLPRASAATQEAGWQGGGRRVSIFKVALGAMVLAEKAESYRTVLMGPQVMIEDTTAALNAGLKHLGETASVVPTLVSRNGYPFPRNLAMPDPNTQGGFIMSQPEMVTRLDPHMGEATRQLRDALRNDGRTVKEIDLTVNWANVAYDPAMDLLILAEDDKHGKPCFIAPQPLRGCEYLVDELVDRLGSPKNVLKFEVAKPPGDPDACYDMDMYYSQFRNSSGHPVALLYSPCIERTPSPAGVLHGAIGRAQAKDYLQGQGITLIELSEKNFLNKATNLINPRPGFVMFGKPVTAKLTDTLQSHGVQSVTVAPPGANREFGLHCLTLEVPEKPEPEEPVGITTMVAGAAVLGAAALIGARCANP